MSLMKKIRCYTIGGFSFLVVSGVVWGLFYYAFFSSDMYAGVKIGLGIALFFPLLFLYQYISYEISEKVDKLFMSGVYRDFPTAAYFINIYDGGVAMIDRQRRLIEILPNGSLVKRYGFIWNFWFFLPSYIVASKKKYPKFLNAANGVSYYLSNREQVDIMNFLISHGKNSEISTYLASDLSFEDGESSSWLSLCTESTYAVLKMGEKKEVRLELQWN